MPKTKSKKPSKPYPDFPLFLHATGQWAKKIRGRMYYFGANPKAALEKYTSQRDDLQAGRTPSPGGDGLTVRDLVNRFLTWKRQQLTSGELSRRTFADYFYVCERIVDHFGKTRLLTQLAASEFGALRAKIAETSGPVNVANMVRRIRTVFKYAWDAELIDKPMRFGPEFKQPGKNVLRRARHERGCRHYTSDECRTLLAEAKQPLRTMILLALNCGFGQSDIASLPRSAVDLENAVIDFPRPKTATARRCPLWPETVDALRDALAGMPKAKSPADAKLVFITKYGSPWVRTVERKNGSSAAVDAVALETTKLLNRLKLKRAGSFYGLRHTFRTVADASKDQPAIDWIMGHVRDDMASEHYRHEISDERLRAVTELVQQWLFPKPKPAPKRKAK